MTDQPPRQQAVAVTDPEGIKLVALHALVLAAELKAKHGISMARNLPTLKEIRRRYPFVKSNTWKQVAVELREKYEQLSSEYLEQPSPRA